MAAPAYLLNNLPPASRESITHQLHDHLDRLKTGANFKHQDKVWNIQVMNDGQRALVRMSSENTIHGWIFQPTEDHPDQVRQFHLFSSPEKKEKTEFEPHAYADYPEALKPLFVEVIHADHLQENDTCPSVPHEVHTYAKTWFNENHIPVTLLPLGMPPTSKDSPASQLTGQVDDTLFKRFFQGLLFCAIVLAAYHLGLRFLAKPPIPSG